MKFDTSQIVKLADSLESFEIAETVRDSINTKLKEFELTTRRAMVAGVNLAESYVESKTMFSPATANRLRASITVGGSLVVLGHYSPRVTYRPAPSNRAKGDKSRGVPAGQRAKSVAVQVRKGQEVELRSAFTMRLKRGTDQGDKIGVFTREGRNRILHRYGLAPYSLFKYQVGQKEDEFMNELQEDCLNRILQRVKEL